jgi:ribosome-associated heat shock protein Hsp15
MKDEVRIDKWLWAARFYKTRSLAAQAVDGGKVQLNESRVKPAKLVRAGDAVRIRKGPFEFQLHVRAIAEVRRDATFAQTLYEESPDSIAERARVAAQSKLDQIMLSQRRESGRPTKRERRALDKMRGRE